MPHTPTFTSLAALAATVRDGDRIGVGGLHFSRLPIALLKQLCALRRRDLHYISWGGGLALEMLLAADSVGRISFCFSSLDIFGLAPLFRAALESGKVESEDWPALAMIQAFHAAAWRLPSMPFQIPRGSDILKDAAFSKFVMDPFGETEVAAARALPLDVFLLHAQRADEDGNIQIQGARGLDMCCAAAAGRILVTVEEIVPSGTFAGGPRAAILSRTQIHSIAVVPGGAYPTSCLPYYTTDYRAIFGAVQHTPPALKEPASQRLEFLARAAKLTPARAREAPRCVPAPGPPTPDEQMAVNLARLYDNESICAAGAVSPLAMVSYLLAKRLYAPNMLLMTMSSGFVDVALRPMLMTLAETLDFQSAVLHCGGEDTYHDFYQPGRVTHEVVGSAQVDRLGQTNTVWLASPNGKRIRLPGQGGMADVANMHRDFTVYLPRHSPQSLVDKVEFVSAARAVRDPVERGRLGWQPGAVRVLTNLGILEFNDELGELELTGTNPGVSVADIQQASGFIVRISRRLAPLDPPTQQELDILRGEIDPLGIRRLEFVSGRDRQPLLQAIIDAEERLIGQLSENRV